MSFLSSHSYILLLYYSSHMIDSHCHLADKQFDDVCEVIERAVKAGVTHMITIADSLPEAEQCVELAEKHEEIYCTVGVHPHHAKDWKRGDSQVLKDMVSGSKKVRAIGEIGLDYHYDHSPRGIQRAVFLEQLTLSRELGLPAVVHCREAIKDVETIVREVEPLQFVLHCCTEKWEDVEWLIGLGHFLSFTGIATYPKSGDIREVIRNCPLSQMMIETDAPYLAPVPHRGKRNEPAFVAEVLKCIAKEKGIGIAEVEAATVKNTVEFFGLPH
jgi:TatD DNase family protein